MTGSLEDRIALANEAIEQTVDPEAAAEREEKAREHIRIKERRRGFLIQMMQHPEGRVWLKEVLDRSHAFETRFAAVGGVARDIEGTWLLAGEQRIGWWVWEQLDEADPVVASRVRRGG